MEESTKSALNPAILSVNPLIKPSSSKVIQKLEPSRVGSFEKSSENISQRTWNKHVKTLDRVQKSPTISQNTYTTPHPLRDHSKSTRTYVQVFESKNHLTPSAGVLTMTSKPLRKIRNEEGFIPKVEDPNMSSLTPSATTEYLQAKLEPNPKKDEVKPDNGNQADFFKSNQDSAQAKTDAENLDDGQRLGIDDLVHVTSDMMPQVNRPTPKSKPKKLPIGGGVRSNLGQGIQSRIPRSEDLLIRHPYRLHTLMTEILSVPPVTSRFFTWAKSIILARWSDQGADAEIIKAYQELSKATQNMKSSSTFEADIKDAVATSSTEDKLGGRKTLSVTKLSKKKRQKLKNNLEKTGNSSPLEHSRNQPTITEVKSKNNHDLWKSEGLDVERMATLYRILNIESKNKMVRIEVTLEDHELLSDAVSLDPTKEFAWLKDRSSASASEFNRRKVVLAFQRQQWGIVKRWKEVRPGLKKGLVQKLERILRIHEPWATFSDIDHMTMTPLAMEVKYLREDPVSSQVLIKVLDIDLKPRVNMIRYMIERPHSLTWWDDAEMRDARRQGLDVIELLHYGDMLNMGDRKFDQGFVLDPAKAKRTMKNLFGRMAARLHSKSIYPMMKVKWGDSPEKAWFKEHPTLNPIWESRMKLIMIGCESFMFRPGGQALRRLNIHSQMPWWSSGELLNWIDHGLPLAEMDELGDRLQLKRMSDLTPQKIEKVNWNTLLAGHKDQERSKIKAYFVTRSEWNAERNLKIPPPSIWQTMKDWVHYVTPDGWVT